MSGFGSGMASAGPRAVGVFAALVFSSLRMFLVPSLFRGHGNAAQQPTVNPIDVQSFRVQADSGDTVECVLRGEVKSGELTLGDTVRVSGRRGWRMGNTVQVSHVRNLATGNVIRPMVPFAVRYALPLAVAKLAVVCILLLVLLAMCGVL